MSIESREATETLADIEQIADRVRQSRFYNFAKLIVVLGGALGFRRIRPVPDAAPAGRDGLDRYQSAGCDRIGRDQRVRPRKIRRANVRRLG